MAANFLISTIIDDLISSKIVHSSTTIVGHIIKSRLSFIREVCASEASTGAEACGQAGGMMGPAYFGWFWNTW